MFVVSFVSYTLTSNNILYRVTSKVIFSTIQVLHLYLRKVKNFLDKIPEYTAVIALTYKTHTEMDMITKFDHRWTRYLF
jgi:hypothetical protein